MILVIAGTYLLFTAGSIALLKLLRKNKGYYYKPRHFTSVFRADLPDEAKCRGPGEYLRAVHHCLVMISTTSSMMLGLEDILHTRYPYDFVLYSDESSAERTGIWWKKFKISRQKQDFPSRMRFSTRTWLLRPLRTEIPSR